MVLTTTETLVVNGVALNTLAKNVESLAGRLRAPAKRTGNIVIPGAHGEMVVPDKKYGPNTLALPMWVVGCDDDGEIPAGSNARKEFFTRVDELVSLFHSPGLLEMVWTTARDEPRRCWGEVLDVLDFTTDATPRGLVGVVFTVPGVFWEDLEDKHQGISGTPAKMTPSAFAGGSAPIEDMIYKVTGPWTNPGIDFGDGSYWQYNAIVAAGRTLTVDSGEWELTGTGGLAVNYAVLDHDGVDAYWGSLPASAPQLTFLGTGRTSASRMDLTGKRKYLVG